MYNPDSPYQNPEDFVGNAVKFPGGSGKAVRYAGIYVYVSLGATVKRVHWAHCRVV